MTREVTRKLLDYLDQGMLNKDYVIRACFSYMSEDDVAEMARINELLFEDDDESDDDESDDDESDDDESDDDEPDDGDYMLCDTGHLGQMTSVSQYGKFLGEFSDTNDAFKFIKQHADKEQFWPNVWYTTDHGNLMLYDLDGNFIR